MLKRISIFIIISFVSVLFGQEKELKYNATFLKDTLLIIVDVQLDNYGKYKFIIDTGAMASIIDNSLVDKLKLKTETVSGKAQGIGNNSEPEKEHELHRLTFANMKVGELNYSNFRPFAINLGHIKEAIGSNIDGVLGSDFLSNYKIVIDYKNGNIFFYPYTDDNKTQDDKRTNFTGYLYVPVKIKNSNVRFLLDTGATHCILSKALVDSLKINLKPFKIDTLIGISSSVGAIQTYIIDTLSVGSKTKTDVPVAIVDLTPFEKLLKHSVDGVIGHNFLKDYILTIDYHQMKMSIK